MQSLRFPESPKNEAKAIKAIIALLRPHIGRGPEGTDIPGVIEDFEALLALSKSQEEGQNVLGEQYKIIESVSDKKEERKKGLREKLNAILNQETALVPEQGPDGNVILQENGEPRRIIKLTRSKNPFYRDIHNALLLISLYWPIRANRGEEKENLGRIICPISHIEITDENRIVLSTGYQFSLHAIEQVPALLFEKNIEAKHKEPYMQQNDLHPRDIHYLQHRAAELRSQVQQAQPNPAKNRVLEWGRYLGENIGWGLSALGMTAWIIFLMSSNPLLLIPLACTTVLYGMGSTYAARGNLKTFLKNIAKGLLVGAAITFLGWMFCSSACSMAYIRAMNLHIPIELSWSLAFNMLPVLLGTLIGALLLSLLRLSMVEKILGAITYGVVQQFIIVLLMSVKTSFLSNTLFLTLGLSLPLCAIVPIAYFAICSFAQLFAPGTWQLAMEAPLNALTAIPSWIGKIYFSALGNFINQFLPDTVNVTVQKPQTPLNSSPNFY